ncbi:MAG: hypothetical protein B6I19_01870, partial [Bacteroidetes bacterium 4572_114]
SSPSDFIRASGRDLVVGAGNDPLKLQGINFWAYSDDLDDDPMEIVFNSYKYDWTDYAKVAALGYNCVRLNMDYRAFEDDDDPYSYKQEGWEWLERNIIHAKNSGIYLLLDMHTPQGGYQSYGFSGDFWGSGTADIANRNRLTALWAEIATRYKDEPAIAGFDIINEPLPPSASDYYTYIQQLVNAIRAVNTNHLIDIEQAFTPAGGSYDHQIVTGTNLMYDTHFYYAWNYASQLIPSYGGNDGGNYPDPSEDFDKNDLETVLLDDGLQFCIDNNVPHNAGEIGLSRYIFPIPEKGATTWMADVYDLHNENKVCAQQWTYHGSGFGLYYNVFGFPDEDYKVTELETFLQNNNTTVFPTAPTSTTYFIDPSGSDGASGLGALNAWATFSHAFGNMGAGDELVLADGTYNQTLEISLTGTSTDTITIRAMNDGQAIIDGEGVRKPGIIGSSGANTDSYIEIEGIIFKNAKSGTDDAIFHVWNNHNTFRRCSFYFAESGSNQQGLAFTHSQYNLAEDCIGAYITRHCFMSWDDNGLETHNTFRRCFATGYHPDRSDSLGISHFNIYGGSYDIVENCIGWYGSQNYGTSVHSQTGANYKCNNNKVLGSIMLGAGQVSTSQWYEGIGISINHAGGEAPKYNEVENCVLFGNQMHGFNIGEEGRTEYTIINHCVMQNNDSYAIRCKDPLTTISNSVFYDNEYGYNSSYHEGTYSFIDNFGNVGNNGVPSEETWPNSFSSDPLITDAGLQIPTNSPCYGTGESGSDVGATICSRYVDGVLTGEPLWPWPMQDRILAELGIDITAELTTKFGPTCQSLWTGNSSTDWGATTNWTGSNIPDDFKDATIPTSPAGGNFPQIGSSAEVSCKNLTIETGASLTIKSNALGTGSLIVEGTSSGNITIERYIAGHTTEFNGWHFLSSPVATFTIDRSGFDPGENDDLYRWEETTSLWMNHKAGDPVQIVSGTGYLVAYQSSGAKTFSGILNNSNITKTNLSYTPVANGTGWHLIGNPFPSAILWDATSWGLSGVNATAKIWKESTASYIDISKNDAIPAAQGFMINVTSATNSITIPLADRSHETQAWYKEDEVNKIKLTAYDTEGNTAQESIIKFNENATTGFDNQYDSRFLSGYAPLFFSFAEGEPVSTNALPELTEALSIPFSFTKNSSSTFNIKAEGIDQLAPSYPVYLTDLKINYTQNLSTGPTYTFTSVEGDNPARFLLHFKPVGIEEESTNQSNILVWATNNVINILNPHRQPGTIRVINMLGQEVMHTEMNGDNHEEIYIGLPSAYFIVSIVYKNGIVNRKVFIE